MQIERRAICLMALFYKLHIEVRDASSVFRFDEVTHFFSTFHATYFIALIHEQVVCIRNALASRTGLTGCEKISLSTAFALWVGIAADIVRPFPASEEVGQSARASRTSVSNSANRAGRPIAFA